MADNKKKRKKKLSRTDVIRILTAACVVVAVILVGVVAVGLKNNDGIGVESQIDESLTSEITTIEEETTEEETEPVFEQITQNVTEQQQEEQTTEKETTEKVTETTEKPTEKTDSESSGRIVVDPEQDLWNLVVVNSGREMPEGYEPQLEYVADSEEEMDYRVAPWYDKMYYAALEDGIVLEPYSGYRSYELQKYNYENLTEEYMYEYDMTEDEAMLEAATVILPPGTSEHNLGLAMDICNTLDSFAEQEEYDWLMQHAHEYGFILRYTEENMDVTGIVDEPWHWRFVGVEYAGKIKESGLCLEEYLDSVDISY